MLYHIVLHYRVLKLKTKWFNKWAKKQSIPDKLLETAIESLTKKQGSIDLGSGLFKVRTFNHGKGKSSGYRTLIVFKEHKLAIFVYGVAKNEKDNLDKDELKYFKKLSKDLLNVNHAKYNRFVELGNFILIKES